MLSWVHKELCSQVPTGWPLPFLPSLYLPSDFASDPLVKLVLLGFVANNFHPYVEELGWRFLFRSPSFFASEYHWFKRMAFSPRFQIS